MLFCMRWDTRIPPRLCGEAYPARWRTKGRYVFSGRFRRMDSSIVRRGFDAFQLPSSSIPNQEIQNHDLSILSTTNQTTKVQAGEKENAAVSTTGMVVAAFDSKLSENSSLGGDEFQRI